MKCATKWFFLSILMLMLLSSIINALPSGPTITYISNSTAVLVVPNRSIDAKGTITTITMNMNQQDYKWKAYVGNVSGKLALDDATGKAIYDWTLGVPAGKVYATRDSGVINWPNITCATQAMIDSEETQLSMPLAVLDNINNTFINTIHKDFFVGTKDMGQSSCRSTATYINGAAQSLSINSNFQEVLLMDAMTNNLVYATFINASTAGYDGSTHNDFQLLIAENESSTIPSTYYFYAELG